MANSVDFLLNNTLAGQIAKKLDAKDGTTDGKISASIWNDFVNGKSGKQIKNSISIADAMNSITTYAVRNAKQGKVDDLAKKWLDSIEGVVSNDKQNLVAGQRPDKDKLEILEPSDKPQAVAKDTNPPAGLTAAEIAKLDDVYDENGRLTCKFERNENGSTIISIIKYQYDENGKKTLETRYYADSLEVEYYNKYEYDNSGNTKSIRYKSDGTPDFSNEYDNNDIKIKKTDYNSDGTVYYTREYNGNGKRTKETVYNSDGTVMVEEYNEAGKKTNETGYNSNGTVDYYGYNIYDDNGNLTKFMGHNASNDTDYTIEYNEKGNRTKETVYNSDGKVDHTLEYEYGENGKKTKETWFYSDGTKRVTEYNDKGEITKITKYDKNGNKIEE